MQNKPLKIDGNFTMFPNFLMDKIMTKVSPAEWKLLTVIVRKTYGFRKDTDRISISQFCLLAGLSNRKVIDGLRTLETIGVIKSAEGSPNGGKTSIRTFWLNQDFDSEPAAKTYELSSQHGAKDDTSLVNSVHSTYELSSQETAKTYELSSYTKESTLNKVLNKGAEQMTPKTNETNEQKKSNQEILENEILDKSKQIQDGKNYEIIKWDRFQEILDKPKSEEIQ